jgi:hypothetical protein
MKEITGDLWDYYGKPDTIVFITTNGTVRQNGELVMGCGCALEARNRFPGIARKLGKSVKQHGNQPFLPYLGLGTFPVKDDFRKSASLDLIRANAEWLAREARIAPQVTFILPRPGCGAGNLTWEQVKSLLEPLPDNVLVISK